MTMNITLPPQLQNMIQSKIASGFYSSESDVIQEALHMMEQDDRLRAAAFEQLKQDIQDGLDSGSAGPIDLEGIKRRGRERLLKSGHLVE